MAVKLEVKAEAKNGVRASYFIVRSDGERIGQATDFGDTKYDETIEVPADIGTLTLDFLLHGKTGGELELTVTRKHVIDPPDPLTPPEPDRIVFLKKSPGYKIGKRRTVQSGVDRPINLENDL